MMTITRSLVGRQWQARASVPPSIIDAAERAAAIADMHSNRRRGYSTPFKVIVVPAMETADISRDTDPTLSISALIGPLFYRRWFSRDPLKHDGALRIIEPVSR